MSNDGDFQKIYSVVCADGLSASSSVVDIALARNLTQLLTQPDPDAGKIVALRNALPPRIEAPAVGEAKPDLSRLNDRDLRRLELLLCKATNEKAPKRKPAREPSDREHRAREIAEWVDRRLQEYGDAQALPLSEQELVWLMSSFGALLGPLTLFSHVALWSAERAGLIELRGYRRVEEAPSAEEPTAPSMDNVVRLDGLPGAAGLRSAPHPQELLRGPQGGSDSKIGNRTI